MIKDTIEFPNLFSGDLHLSRVAFSISGFDVYWYGLIILLGVILGFTYALKRANKFGLLADDVFDVAFWGVIGGFVGARAYFCIFHNLNPASKFQYNFITAITGIRDGGLAIYGGIIGAVIVGLITARLKKIRFLPLLDLACPGFLIGQSLGRWANFFNQEAFGAPTAGDLPWGMTGSIIVKDKAVIAAQEALDAAGGGYALVHPCFLYESLWCALGLLLLYLYSKKLRSFDGEIVLLYVMWYGAGRGFIEGLRTDSLYFFIGDAGIRVSQLIGFASAAFALLLFVYFKVTLRKSKGYLMYCEKPESIEKIAKYKADMLLKKEQEAARKELRKAEKEAAAPVAPSILGDEEETNAADDIVSGEDMKNKGE